MNLTNYVFKAPFIALANGTSESINEVPIRPLLQRDRLAAERHSPNDSLTQDDYMLHRMTGIPLDAINALAMVDADGLLEQYVTMAGLDQDEPTEMVEAGTMYPLFMPITTPRGEVQEVRLTELTRGDQKKAAQFTKRAAEQESFLIGRMTSLQMEDVAKMHLRDVFALRGLFRRVIAARKANAQDRSGLDAGAQGLNPGQPVADVHV